MIRPILINLTAPIYNRKEKVKPDYSSVPSHFVPVYKYNPSFMATNVAIVEQMTKTKDIGELKKLFNQMTQKAQSNVNGLVEIFKNYLTLEVYIQSCVK